MYDVLPFELLRRQFRSVDVAIFDDTLQASRAVHSNPVGKSQHRIRGQSKRWDQREHPCMQLTRGKPQDTAAESRSCSPLQFLLAPNEIVLLKELEQRLIHHAPSTRSP